jgi:hypothetical protein
MTFLLGPVVVLLFFGAMDVAGRVIGIPFSVFGALGAVLRQTDEPKLQRRQALTLMLLVVGTITLTAGAMLLAIGSVSRWIVGSVVVGAIMVSLAGNVGTRTLRAIGQAANKAREVP